MACSMHFLLGPPETELSVITTDIVKFNRHPSLISISTQGVCENDDLPSNMIGWTGEHHIWNTWPTSEKHN